MGVRGLGSFVRLPPILPDRIRIYSKLATPLALKTPRRCCDPKSLGWAHPKLPRASQQGPSSRINGQTDRILVAVLPHYDNVKACPERDGLVSKL